MKSPKVVQGAFAAFAVISMICSNVSSESISPRESLAFRVPGLCCLPPVINNNMCTDNNGQTYPINLRCDENSLISTEQYHHDEEVSISPDYK